MRITRVEDDLLLLQLLSLVELLPLPVALLIASSIKPLQERMANAGLRAISVLPISQRVLLTLLPMVGNINGDDSPMVIKSRQVRPYPLRVLVIFLEMRVLSLLFMIGAPHQTILSLRLGGAPTAPVVLVPLIGDYPLKLNGQHS